MLRVDRSIGWLLVRIRARDVVLDVRVRVREREQRRDLVLQALDGRVATLFCSLHGQVRDTQRGPGVNRKTVLPVATGVFALLATVLILWRFAVVGPAWTDGVAFWEGPIRHPRPQLLVVVGVTTLSVLLVAATAWCCRRDAVPRNVAIFSSLLLLCVGAYVLWLQTTFR